MGNGLDEVVHIECELGYADYCGSFVLGVVVFLGESVDNFVEKWGIMEF